MDKEKFDAMLALAEFGAERMERRRTTEFQIFISYTTLIVLGIYVIITKHDTVDDVFINGSAVFLCILLILINLILYCHRKFGPLSKTRLWYNNNLIIRSSRWQNENEEVSPLKPRNRLKTCSLG